MDAITTQVLIVGAGPAGLAAAIGLAERKIDFVIIDALPEAQNTSRAAVIHAATLESLRALKVSDRLIRQGIKVPHFRIRDRDSVLLETDFSDLSTPTPFALMIPQDETEQILIDRLSELGHQVLRPVEFARYETHSQGIRASCTGKQDITIDARYMVGADGEKSAVRSAACIAFPGNTYGSFMLADVRMNWPIDRNEVTLFFSGAGTLVVAPMSRERYRVVAQWGDAPSTPTINDVQNIIDARGPRSGVHVRELIWGSRFQVHHKLADRFQEGNVLLLGDAAHVHSPAGGQGMNLGLRDAQALSSALGEALRNGSEAALRSYAQERRQAAAEVLKMTDRLTKVATMGNPAARWIRNRLIAALGTLPVVRRAAARRLAGYS
ncbi:FAD-binding protein [Mesorhizobium sp. NBSH29]|uniref:FAD-dependent oxidoreductase n=1 Tax=Mesorhizobium sp. NBSH29 TaxID=2654249 RepID=UPI0018968483|nr:FAD-dependent monooxygenase [Mesorhizobium sp. NBSH29]QPC86775.1 FAD-binding protein [Mesorhizobium sp. NBSH29]